MSEAQTDVVIVGGGLAGLTAALAFKSAGHAVTLVSPAQTEEDWRTTALLNHSMEYLDSLGIGAAVRRAGAQLATMRIVDATDRLFRAPQVNFHASEIDLETFGYNIANRFLADTLRSAADDAGTIFLDARVESLDMNATHCIARLSNGGSVNTSLVIGADGRNSEVREFAGIGVRRWSYPQSAIVLNFRHQFPHDDASTEFHTDTGPFTIVPLEPKAASLVWVLTPSRAEEVKHMSGKVLAAEIERNMQSMLGRIEIVSPVQSFPLSGLVARKFGRGRLALVGESAHVFPPIGAQGFNLGIRDVETLAGLVGEPADFATLGDRYSTRRTPDIVSRGAAVDLLNRSLLAEFLPAQIARSFGLAAIGSIPPLRRLAMREGIAPGLQAKTIADRLSGIIDGLRGRMRPN